MIPWQTFKFMCISSEIPDRIFSRQHSSKILSKIALSDFISKKMPVVGGLSFLMSTLWWLKRSTEFNAVYHCVRYSSIHSVQCWITAVVIQLGWMPCSVTERYKHFGQTCCLYLYSSPPIPSYSLPWSQTSLKVLILYQCWYRQLMFLTSSTDLMFQNIKAQHHPASTATIQNISEGKRRTTTSLHT
jgi:hypothetical protein